METVIEDIERKRISRELLFKRFQAKIVSNPRLGRRLVSFQANRNLAYYNWLKYKEGFSAELVGYIIDELTDKPGLLLDPFVGSGTSFFVGRAMGWDTIGIELMPVGFFAIDARLAAEEIEVSTFKRFLRKLKDVDWEEYYEPEYALRHIPITKGAFSQKTERRLAGYRAYCNKKIRNVQLRKLFELACLGILESISYTRKDGQYLRWDYRAGKSRSKRNFSKGDIADFNWAIYRKLEEIYQDLSRIRQQEAVLFDYISNTNQKTGSIDLRKGSCLDVLPRLKKESIDLVITSPPYCNRYDYTRTYALELVYLGLSAEDVKQLRQDMLSCTVENREKVAELEMLYRQLDCPERFEEVRRVFTKQKALHEVLGILTRLGSEGRLNNVNIPNMVQNYFLEMCFVIRELARVLKPGGKVAMVNDNVRYAGEEVPVDLILSDFAASFGIKTKHIWTLGRGKGNSSQQMGNHGRTELRKCVYIWEKGE